jgi:hypothetical protein
MRKRIAEIAASLCLAAGASTASAESLTAPRSAAVPLDLSDRATRPIRVRFEISPADRPGDRAQRFSAAIDGRAEPAALGYLRVVIPSEAVERYLLADQDPLPGSFSDFVWLLDTATGDVISAELSGVLRRQVNWGLVGARVEAQIEARMSTRTDAGFRSPVTLLGHRIFSYCGPDESDCELVPAARFDPQTGYVNAVGEISARSSWLTTKSFSPLGEAIFEELGAAL